jgi:transposase
MPSKDLIFIDESGANLCMIREYARIVGGERIKMPVPAGHGPKLSMISAISVDEVVTSMYGEWSTDGEIFMTFIEKCLVPKLSPGKTVILDNVPFHKNKRVKEAIEATGAKIKFLPPYSPDFSPIENMWSKVKSILRKFAPRTLGDFKRVIKKAFTSISQTDLIGWFKHCGYVV